ncbi:DUF418 domain-containing protein [Pseudoalteromonas sp. MMG022]|uniref:DUF418 domain-containing protein n=1 Tax=Pseudoalteromonas sp. MMG022 TaxID=2909978 RepID=UPI001F2E22EF|nr:DUF418 domain-containing protein [Pseudoalteromonas sp. MMG022]MCF6437134.1 DUF418 domain-containing protein [Pseudoalteromonas sp. MMG022]
MTRLVGIDVARALALFGMVIVNFKLVMGVQEGDSALYYITSLIEGRASALFVILAGVGLSFMATHDAQTRRLPLVRWQIFKRAIVLFAIGLAYTPIWPADILHFYGLYFVVAACVITFSNRSLLWVCAGLIVGFVLLLSLLNYEQGWHWDTLVYKDMWSWQGMFRHLFFNGFHPVLPWAAFLVFGIWLARQPLLDKSFQHAACKRALTILILMETTLWLLRSWLELDNTDKDLGVLLSSQMMPPLPTYMVSASCSATLVLIGCIWIAQRWHEYCVFKYLAQVGRLSLTFYVAHVLIGMGTLEALNMLGGQTIETAILCAAIFCLAAVLVSALWLAKFRSGPLEALFRVITK